MSKKTKFKQMLKNIDNIYIYVGFHEKTYKVKIDRNHKEHRLLLTSKKYSKRWYWRTRCKKIWFTIKSALHWYNINKSQ